MTTTRYRILLTGLGIAFALVVIGAVIFAPSGNNPTLPKTLESYSPQDGATVLRQTQLVVDLEPGFVIELTLDGVRIPDSEIEGVRASGRFVWTPGPGKTFEAWSPGFHAVEVQWQREVGLPEPGSLRWSFRIQ